MAKINEWTQLTYLLGWIEMLDAYQRTQGVDEKTRILKKQFVTSHAVKMTVPDIDVQEVNDFLKQIGEMKIEEPLIAIMQKKVDRDNMVKSLQGSQYDLGGPQFGI